MHSLQCPNCGDALPVAFQAAKMATCPSCETTVFLDGDQIALAGQAGVMHAAPQLFHLGGTARIGTKTYSVAGHARFDYGPGWWDEYWVIGQNGEGAWISVDEGDVIVQQKVPRAKAPSLKTRPELGERFEALGQTFVVTECDKGTCIALRGTFPERLKTGETFDYINCQNDHNALLSGEFSGTEVTWFTGMWCDPFDVKSTPAP